MKTVLRQRKSTAAHWKSSMGMTQPSCLWAYAHWQQSPEEYIHTGGHHGTFHYIPACREAEFLPQWVEKENLAPYTVGHHWHRDTVLCKISQLQETTNAVWFYLHWLLEQQIQRQTAGCCEAASADEGWGVLIGEGPQFRRCESSRGGVLMTTQQWCSSCRRATHLKMAGMADFTVGVYDYHWVC